MKQVLLFLIRLYQKTFSSWRRNPCCRFSPSCSHYGLEAIGRFGAVRGGWLTFKRIVRCNPWGGSGYDPVPETYPKLKFKKISFRK